MVKTTALCIFNMDEFITVFVAGNLIEAEIIKGRLEIEGIPVLLSYESLGPVTGITVDGLAEVKIRVPESMEVAAREILSRRYD